MIESSLSEIFLFEQFQVTLFTLFATYFQFFILIGLSKCLLTVNKHFQPWLRLFGPELFSKIDTIEDNKNGKNRK